MLRNAINGGGRSSRTLLAAAPMVTAAASAMASYEYYSNIHSSAVAACEEQTTSNIKRNAARLQRKQTTLQHAATTNVVERRTRPTARRINTRQQLSTLRESEKEMLLRWERDEDGWRELPARAWPVYQPNPEQMKSLQAQVLADKNCTPSSGASDLCKELLFNVATALVFYNIDAKAGLRQFEALAEEGHVDSMVACGVVLVEGMGVQQDDRRGLEWLEKAVTRNSAQGCYELGTVLYTGIDEVLDEDPEAAYELFRRAAEQDHTSGMYMMADCLVEGEGTPIDMARAVPLFYKAAERGHRYSRQRIRELLANKEYKT